VLKRNRVQRSWWAGDPTAHLYHVHAPRNGRPDALYDFTCREEQVKIAKLRVCRYPFNGYLHRCSRHDTGLGASCLEYESVQHVLMDCPARREQRVKPGRSICCMTSASRELRCTLRFLELL
jgi:hypothetical protein